MLLLLTSILALLSPKAAEQTVISSKPTVKISVQIVVPPPTGIGLAWDFPAQLGIAYSTLYWGTNHATYTWKTNVPYPASGVWIAPDYPGQPLYLTVTCTGSNTVFGTTNLVESPPSYEIMTFIPPFGLTNAPGLNFASPLKYRIETAAPNVSGPWTGYLTTNWTTATGNQYFRINFVR